MTGMKWIKIDTGIFDDSKIRLIESMPEGNTLVVIWFRLLILAGKEFTNGVFMINDKIACTDEMLATIFGKPIATIRLALETFQKLNMIDLIDGAYSIPNWNKYQSADKYEINRARDRKRLQEWRKKQQDKKRIPQINATSQNETFHETFQKCNETATEIEKEIEKEIYKEKAVAVKTPLSLIREFSGTNKELLESLRAWLEMRKKMHRPLTGRATQQALKKLNELSGGNQDVMVQIVDQTSLKGWLTFYPLKENKPGTLGSVLEHMDEIIPDAPEDDQATTAWLREEGILDD
mgnify:CR=1 FL=1|jgi:predicted phage replisome organizer